MRNFFGGNGIIAFPRAVAQELGNISPLLAPVLRAKDTAYSYNLKEDTETVEDPFMVGEQISLVSTMQARNSARFTVFGSSEALENIWFDAQVKVPEGKETKTANREFVKQITSWTFKETGVLKVGKVEHHLSETLEVSSGNKSVAQLGYLNPKIYRVKNDVVCCPPQTILTLSANTQNRPTQSNSRSTKTLSSFLLLFPLPTPSSSNSACSLLFTVYPCTQSRKLRTAPYSALPSVYQTNMVSFPLESTTKDPS